MDIATATAAVAAAMAQAVWFEHSYRSSVYTSMISCMRVNQALGTADCQSVIWDDCLVDLVQ